MMMTNGFGATIGMLGAQIVVNHFVYSHETAQAQLAGWQTSWYIFATYSLVVTIMFAILFKYKHNPNSVVDIRH